MAVRRRPRPRTWIAALAVAALLTGCTPVEKGEPDVDLAAIRTELTSIDGVVDASTATRNTGAPGSYALQVKLVVDEAGLAAVTDVLQSAIDDVAAAATGDDTYREYEFAVSVVDPTSPTGTRRVTLGDRVEGALPGTGPGKPSLILSADDLAAAAG